MNIFDLEYIETPRLIIRPPKLGDEIELDQAINNSLDSLQAWEDWALDHPNMGVTKGYVQEGIRGWESRISLYLSFTIIHKEDKKIICRSSITKSLDPQTPYYEVAYWMEAQYQGQGLVTELVNAITRFLLEAVKIPRVQIRTQAKNVKSTAVAERCGFRHELTLKNTCYNCQTNLPVDVYTLSCCDIKKLPDLEVSWFENKNKNTQESDISFYPSKNVLISKHPNHTKKPFETDNLIIIPDESNDLLFIVFDKEKQYLVGKIYFKIRGWGIPYTSIGFVFDVNLNNNYNYEAVNELVKYAFNDLKLKHLCIEVPEKDKNKDKNKDNNKVNLAQSLGFVHSGTLQNHRYNSLSNDMSPTEIYAMYM